MLNTALLCPCSPGLPRPASPPLTLKQDRPLAWERWAYTFAQLRQLAALAPHLPTEAPQLKPATYGMVLSSLLLHPSGEWLMLCCALAKGLVAWSGRLWGCNASPALRPRLLFALRPCPPACPAYRPCCAPVCAAVLQSMRCFWSVCGAGPRRSTTLHSYKQRCLGENWWQQPAACACHIVGVLPVPGNQQAVAAAFALLSC